VYVVPEKSGPVSAASTAFPGGFTSSPAKSMDSMEPFALGSPKMGRSGSTGYGVSSPANQAGQLLTDWTMSGKTSPGYGGGQAGAPQGGYGFAVGSNAGSGYGYGAGQGYGQGQGSSPGFNSQSGYGGMQQGIANRPAGFNKAPSPGRGLLPPPPGGPAPKKSTGKDLLDLF
jgi:hypothetical protein